MSYINEEEHVRQHQQQHRPESGGGSGSNSLRHNQNHVSFVAAGPVPSLLVPSSSSASSAEYESVIRDLRERGMEDLASELVRRAFTAPAPAFASNSANRQSTNTSASGRNWKNSGGSPLLAWDQQRKSASSKPSADHDAPRNSDALENDLQEQSVATRGVALLADDSRPEEETAADPLALAKIRELEKAQAYNHGKNNDNASDKSRDDVVQAMFGTQGDATSSPDLAGETPISQHEGASEGEVGPSEPLPTAAANASTSVALPFSDDTRPGVPTPTQLVRNDSDGQGFSDSRVPGAYSVTPGNGSSRRGNGVSTRRVFSCYGPNQYYDEDVDSFGMCLSSGSSSSHSNSLDQADPDGCWRSIDHTSDVTLRTQANSMEEEDVRQRQLGEEEENQQRTSTSDMERGQHSLEAVRVDDIMTVKAEPLIENPKKLKQLICLATGLVCMVLIVTLSVALIRDKSDGADDAATARPTLSPTLRRQVILQLLNTELGPIYDSNYTYNGASGIVNFSSVMENTSSPQYQAFEWLMMNPQELDKSINVSANDPNDYLVDTGRILQRYALAALHLSTSTNMGTNWTDRFQFLSMGHECDWSGALQCSEEDNIITLDLRNNGLHGIIPLEISLLTKLQSLILADNRLSGTLPPVLSRLTELQSIDLELNQLSGTVPVEYYRNWLQLEKWVMGENRITGTINKDIAYLTNLKHMSWIRNSLHGSVPAEMWTALTDMEYIDLSQQAFGFVNDTISREIGRWSNLHTLIHHGLNLVGTIPSELGQLTLLTRLQLTSNHLTGTVPSELGMLSLVTWLSLSINGLTGTLPTTLLRLTNMDRFYADHTLLSGDVTFLCEAVDNGTMTRMDPMRVDKGEVSGCYCCNCCDY